MLYNLNINQYALIKIVGTESKLNSNHYIILNVLHMLQTQYKSLRYVDVDNVTYFWASTKIIQNQVPLFNYSLKTIKRYILDLCNAELLQRSNKNEELGKMLVRFTDKFTLTMFTNIEGDKLEYPPVQIKTPPLYQLDPHNLINNNLIKEKNKEIRKEEEYCVNLTIPTQSIQKENKLVTFIENQEAVELHKEYFITSLKIAVEKDYPEHVERCIINKDVFDLYEVSDMTDIKREMKNFLQSPEMLQLKKTIRTNHTLLPKPYNRYNYQKHFATAGKIRVSNNLFMYSYQVVTLKALFNHNFIIKQLELIDNYLDDDKNYRKYADHYIFVKNWLKREAEKHNERDQFDYYLFGGSRNELL